MHTAMASQTAREYESPLTLVNSQTHSDPDSGTTVSVKCGSTTGALFVDKIKDYRGNIGNLKCIFSESTWYSPIDFEALGGKAKSRNWRRSILHENKPLSTLLSTLGVQSDKSSSPSPPSTTSLNVTQSSQTPLTNPLLAFVKAYRLRGDASGLRRTLLPAVDASSLVAAYKALWQHCKTDLETLGLFF